MRKVAAPLMVIAAVALLQVLAWASYDVTGSSPPSPFGTGVHVPAACAEMTFDNVITGTAGNDEITMSGSTRDPLFGLGGGEGDDELEGGNGDDVILGGPGNDEIEGENGDDRLFGRGGSDRIKGGKG